MKSPFKAHDIVIFYEEVYLLISCLVSALIKVIILSLAALALVIVKRLPMSISFSSLQAIFLVTLWLHNTSPATNIFGSKFPVCLFLGWSVSLLLDQFVFFLISLKG